MNLQGSAPINTAQFDDQIEAINQCTDCATLHSLATRTLDSLNGVISVCSQQIDLIAPLMSPPTDLGSVITWITNFIAPMATAHATLTTQVAELGDKVNDMQTAVDNKITALGCSPLARKVQ